MASFNLPWQQNNEDRNADATLYIGNLDDKVSDNLLWELMLQAGPVVNVNIPRDRVSALHQGFGFVEFATEDDADYALKIMSMIKLFGKPIKLNKASAERRQFDIGASLFIGNLAGDVDEKMLYDTFSAFGTITQTPKVSRESESGLSKGYGFISFDSFEAADAAIESMNGQYLMNKPITLTYAYKKDGKGEKHGSIAERLLAAQGKKNFSIPGFLGPAGAPLPAGFIPPVPSIQPPSGITLQTPNLKGLPLK